MEHYFEITITGTEHHTWQGHLLSGGEPVPFRSELELLLALARLLPPGRAEDPEPFARPDPISHEEDHYET